MKRRKFILAVSAFSVNPFAYGASDSLAGGPLIGRARESGKKGKQEEEADDEFAKKELGESGAIIDGQKMGNFNLLELEQKAREWRACEAILQLREQINAKARNRKTKPYDGTIGDAAHASRDSDHNPWIVEGRYGVVSAIDIQHDAAGGCDCADIVSALHKNRDPRIKYIIWNRKIAYSRSVRGEEPWKWLDYGGKNPHTAHFHLSVKSEKEHYDGKEAWNLNPWA